MCQPWSLESYLFLFKLLLFSGQRIILALFRLGSPKVSKCPAQRGMSLICREKQANYIQMLLFVVILSNYLLHRNVGFVFDVLKSAMSSFL